MIPTVHTDPIRKRIESLGTRLSLPITRRALGALEGEHSSLQRGHGYDFLDLRTYQPDDEAQLIDWKASARSGKPIIVNKQREVTSTVWLILDTSAQMMGTSQGGEPLLNVAANALRMFAMLSLKRSDDISLVFGDSRAITRLPFSGGYSKFNTVLDTKLAGLNPANRNMQSLLEYAAHVRGKNSLIVIASDESAMKEEYSETIKMISQNHPLVFIAARALNPFSPHLKNVTEATTGKLLPAFMRTESTEKSVATRREFLTAAFERHLSHGGDTLLRAGSSNEMLDAFTHLISTRLHGSRPRMASLLPSLAQAAHL